MSYDDIVIECIRHFDMRLSEIEQMTMAEFFYKQYAHQYKQVDEQYKMHLQAFLNYSVQSTKSIGGKEKPVYEKFVDFFDYEKALDAVEGKTAKDEMDDGMKKIIYGR